MEECIFYWSTTWIAAHCDFLVCATDHLRSIPRFTRFTSTLVCRQFSRSRYMKSWNFRILNTHASRLVFKNKRPKQPVATKSCKRWQWDSKLTLFTFLYNQSWCLALQLIFSYYTFHIIILFFYLINLFELAWVLPCNIDKTTTNGFHLTWVFSCNMLNQFV